MFELEIHCKIKAFPDYVVDGLLAFRDPLTEDLNLRVHFRSLEITIDISWIELDIDTTSFSPH